MRPVASPSHDKFALKRDCFFFQILETWKLFATGGVAGAAQCAPGQIRYLLSGTVQVAFEFRSRSQTNYTWQRFPPVLPPGSEPWPWPSPGLAACSPGRCGKVDCAGPAKPTAGHGQALQAFYQQRPRTPRSLSNPFSDWLKAALNGCAATPGHAARAPRTPPPCSPPR